MDTSNLGRGALIAGVSGALLFIFMFLAWYGAGGAANELVEQAQEAADALGVQGPENVDTTVNAWESFDIIDLILFLAAATAIAFAVTALAGLSVELPVALSAIVTGIGALAFLLVFYRLINPPGEGDVDREIGLYLGLLATAGVTIGGYLGMQEEGASFNAR
ncbi:MAG: hypothetical protein M3O25_09645 [Actinomycetota bacterium]|nr:hypothetical protein [Actinomycetota bacterium]